MVLRASPPLPRRDSLPRRGSRFCRPLLLVALIAALCWCAPADWTAQSAAQPQQNIPSLHYQAAFTDFYAGDYEEALKEFRSEGRGAIKIGTIRWIDSICYETMVGECYYHMGYLDEALGHYTAALTLYSAYSNWLLQVQFQPIRWAGAASRVVVPWGGSTRGARLGYYPNSTPVMRGRINNNDAVRHGGVVVMANLRPVHVQEIVRCTTLAIRRRAQLMGPVARHDALFAELIDKLRRRPGPPNHWSSAWIDAQLGMAYIAGGQEAEGQRALLRAQVANGEYDHQMTSIVLFELGRLAMARGNYEPALNYFAEASYSAVQYTDLGILEESLRYGALAHLLANKPGLYPALEPAIQWAKIKDYRHLYVSLLLSATENLAALRQTPRAAATAEQARLGIARRQMAAGRIGARLQFLTALCRFQQQQITAGDAALTTAMAYMKKGSFWTFQIGLADNLYTTGTITPRVAMDLYDTVLRDPQPVDWAADPMEALSVLINPHPVPIEHWFEVALNRKEHEKALEIADRARRHRFFTSLTLGGRLQSLRWVLEAPDAVLDPRAQLTRRDLLARYPAYDALVRQARAHRAKLDALPPVAEDPDTVKLQQIQLEALSKVSLHKELILREIAVRREAADLVFPPIRGTRDIQKSLPPGHAMLAFFATRRHLYGFLMNKDKYTYWEAGSPNALTPKIAGLLREMGHFQQNGEIAVEELTSEKWKASAAKLLDSLLAGSGADFTKKFDELVVVPDGVLWYLPFEALQVNVGGRYQPLISRFRVRYAPTASLATWTGRGRKPAGATGVVVGKLFPQDDETVAQAAFGQLAKVLPGTLALKSPPPAESRLYAPIFDRLVVLDDLRPPTNGPYAWTPMPLDQGRPGNYLADWMNLPWGAPDEVILPGYHTAAEASLKGVGWATGGNEVFLSVCGMMASGSQTVLLSRWRTGGQTSFDLVREFAQELPHASPSEAWQRSVFLAASSKLNLEAEPRVKRAVVTNPPAANHPFFWAGYMLVDSGVAPKVADPAPVDPVLVPKQPLIPKPPGVPGI